MKVFYWSLGRKLHDKEKKYRNRQIRPKILELTKLFDKGVVAEVPDTLDVNRATAYMIQRYVANQIAKDDVAVKAGGARRSPEELVPHLFKFAYGEFKPRMVRTEENWKALHTWEHWLMRPTYPSEVRNLAPKIDPVVKVANAAIAIKRKFRREATSAQKQSPMNHLVLSRNVLETQMIAFATNNNPGQRFTRELTINIIDRLNSPIYRLAGCVPELVMTVLLPGCGTQFVNYIRNMITKYIDPPMEFFTTCKLICLL